METDLVLAILIALKRSRVSAGLVLYRVREGALEVLLVHPGGPYFVRKDGGHWSIPKGEVRQEEEMLHTAIRELKEEVGIELSSAERFLLLGSIRQKGGKIVHAWAVETPNVEPQLDKTQTFEMEWPPGSGRRQRFPEVDRAAFFGLPEALRKVKESQVPLLERLAKATTR